MSVGWQPFSPSDRKRAIAQLKLEQQRLQLTASAQLLEATIYRRLYKVGAVIHPGERKRALMDYLYELFHNPAKRREKEIELCHTFSKDLGRPLSGHEILIDIPGFNKSPEVDLKVFYGPENPSDKADPLTFDNPEVTRLRDSLLDNFEDQAKIFRIFCMMTQSCARSCETKRNATSTEASLLRPVISVPSVNSQLTHADQL